jgi:hypothetical protein
MRRQERGVKDYFLGVGAPLGGRLHRHGYCPVTRLPAGHVGPYRLDRTGCVPAQNHREAGVFFGDMHPIAGSQIHRVDRGRLDAQPNLAAAGLRGW